MRTSEPPFLSTAWMLGSAARMRLSSVMLPASSWGTLKSTRISTRRPFTSRSFRPSLRFMGPLFQISKSESARRTSFQYPIRA